MICSTVECKILKYIDSLEYDDLIYYTKCYVPTDLKHYMSIQIQWMKEAKYLLGLKINKNPDDIQLINEWNMYCNSERFRAFYVLYYVDKVVRLEPEYFI